MIGSFLRKAMFAGGACAATSEPDQVGGLTATASGSTTINLSWTADSTAAPNQATSFDVDRSNDGLGSWTSIATGLTTNSYSDTSLSASTTRYYRVTAYNCYGGALASASDSATTAAGSIAPAWEIDFSTGSTYADLVLTRASTGTFVDSSGYIASASIDAARLTHNSSGSRLGLLVEEQRQNLALRSEDFTTTWTNSNTTETADAATAPDSATTADELIESAGTNVSRLIQQNISWTSGTTYTVSVYAKANTATCLNIVGGSGAFGSNEWASFNVSAGTVGSVGTSVTGSDATIEDVGNGWYRCKLTMVATNTASASCPIVLTNNTSSTTRIPTYTVTSGNERSLYIWGYQAEAGANATSYIPTAGSSVTRSADLAHVLDSSITSWGDPGALVIHFYPPGQAGTLLSTDDASTAQVGIEASTTTAARAFWSSGSTATETLTTGVQKAVHYWNGSTSKFALNGSTPVSGTNNLTIANTDFVTLGAEATDSGGAPSVFSQYANCVIRKVEFYSGTLTDANLQTITT